MPLFRLGHSDGQVTGGHVPDDDTWTDQERFNAITHDDGANQGIWPSHGHSRSPVWVESNDPDFAAKLADFYGCPVGEPQSVGEGDPA